ncbi:hypothetical protein ACFL6E_06550 [Candidatus Neomarinimicrobiota bacterium]
MRDRSIQELWDRGKSKEKEMTMEDLEMVLRPGVTSQSNQLRLGIWIYLGALLATLVFDVLNIVGYWNNPVYLPVHLVLTVLALLFFAFGLHLLAEFRKIERRDEPLLLLINRRYRLYRTKYEIWYWLMAATTLLLIFGVTTYIDNMDGQYYINRPLVFFRTLVVIFIFIYAVNKLGHYPLVKQMRATQADLEEQDIEHSVLLEGLLSKWRIAFIISTILFSLIFLWGLWRAFQ